MLRQTEIIPRLDGTRALDARAVGPAAVVARWQMGDDSLLVIGTNLGTSAAVIPQLDWQAAVCQFERRRASGAKRYARALFHSRVPENEMNNSSVRELARRAGIAVQWTDHVHKRHRVPLDTIRRILAALELPCDTSDEITHSQRALDNATIPPLITATAGRACRFAVANSGALRPVPASFMRTDRQMNCRCARRRGASVCRASKLLATTPWK